MATPYHGYPNESLYHEAHTLAAEIEALQQRLAEVEAQRDPSYGRYTSNEVAA